MDSSQRLTPEELSRILHLEAGAPHTAALLGHINAQAAEIARLANWRTLAERDREVQLAELAEMWKKRVGALSDELDTAQTRIAALEVALRFYADPDHWTWPPVAVGPVGHTGKTAAEWDGGGRARTVLDS